VLEPEREVEVLALLGQCRGVSTGKAVADGGGDVMVDVSGLLGALPALAALLRV